MISVHAEQEIIQNHKGKNTVFFLYFSREKGEYNYNKIKLYFQCTQDWSLQIRYLSRKMWYIQYSYSWTQGDNKHMLWEWHQIILNGIQQKVHLWWGGGKNKQTSFFSPPLKGKVMTKQVKGESLVKQQMFYQQDMDTILPRYCGGNSGSNIFTSKDNVSSLCQL